MTIDYSWMNSALAWIAPVAAHVNSFYVYPNKRLAFGGVTVTEYDTPFALTKEPFGLQFQPAKTINWSKVTGLAVGKTCDVSVSGGKVKLPMIEHLFDPEPISLVGKSYPASDVITAVQQTIGAVDRGVLGWPNCIHFDGDSVISTPVDTSVLHHRRRARPRRPRAPRECAAPVPSPRRGPCPPSSNRRGLKSTS